MATKKKKTSEAAAAGKALLTGTAESVGAEESNPRKGGFAATVKRWKPGDYLLQLSTVIIGILVTFGGSGLLTKCSERRDTAIILSMVKEELQKNAALIERRKSMMLFDYNGSLALRPYMDNAGEMHPDSLAKYLPVVGNYETFTGVTNSFEVLKSSSQVQSIRNKKLLIELFTTYENIRLFENGVAEYNSLKEKGINDLFFYSDVERYMSGSNQDNILLFTDMMKVPLFRNFIVHVSGGNWSYIRNMADPLLVEISKTIELIDKETGYRN